MSLSFQILKLDGAVFFFVCSDILLQCIFDFFIGRTMVLFCEIFDFCHHFFGHPQGKGRIVICHTITYIKLMSLSYLLAVKI